jgi:transposase-like protein
VVGLAQELPGRLTTSPGKGRSSVAEEPKTCPVCGADLEETSRIGCGSFPDDGLMPPDRQHYRCPKCQKDLDVLRREEAGEPPED